MRNIEKLDRPDWNRETTSLELGCCPAGYVSFHYPRPLLDQIRREVLDKFLSIPRGGLEIGGVLFGAISGGEVHLLDYRTLEIEYLSGPSFLLSEADQANLETWLQAADSDPALAGMEPIGWYHSHTRSEILLSAEDIAIHEKFFPRPENIALVIKPHKFEPAQIGVFVRDADGSMPGNLPRATFALQLPGPVPVPVPVPAQDVPPQEVLQRNEVTVAPSPQPSKRSSIPYLKTAVLAAVFLLGAGGIAALKYFGPRLPARSEPAPMWLHVSNSGDDLTIAWDRSFLAEARARTAEILITDAGQETARVPLDREPLSRGSITYARRSGNVEVRMRVQAGTDRLLEQGVRFIGSPPAPPPEPLAVAPMESQPPEGSRSRSVSPPQDNLPRPIGRAFVPTTVKPETQVISLPPSPNLMETPAALPASPAWQPPVIATPASPPPAPLRVASRFPSSGRSIWTGRLPKGGLLLLDGARPSVGTLSSPLPQGPATYRVYAADLGDAGIIVYAEGKNGDTIESPSAANGWNLTTYNADIKRARSVKVLEYPGQQNGWKRLLLRSENRPVSMIVIDWKDSASASPAK